MDGLSNVSDFGVEQLSVLNLVKARLFVSNTLLTLKIFLKVLYVLHSASTFQNYQDLVPQNLVDYRFELTRSDK